MTSEACCGRWAARGLGERCSECPIPKPCADNVYSDANARKDGTARDESTAKTPDSPFWDFVRHVDGALCCDICGELGVAERQFEGERPLCELFVGDNDDETVRCGRPECDPNTCRALDVPEGGASSGAVGGHPDGLAPGAGADAPGAVHPRSLPTLPPSSGETGVYRSNDVADGELASTLGVLPDGSLNPAVRGPEWHAHPHVASVYLDNLTRAWDAVSPDYALVILACRKLERIAHEATAFAELLAERPDSPIPWAAHLRTSLTRAQSILDAARTVVGCELPVERDLEHVPEPRSMGGDR